MAFTELLVRRSRSAVFALAVIVAPALVVSMLIAARSLEMRVEPASTTAAPRAAQERSAEDRNWNESEDFGVSRYASTTLGGVSTGRPLYHRGSPF